MAPLILLLGVLASTAPSTAPTTVHSPPKYLIEFGWDEPTTAFMREHIAQMEQTPFDGIVYHVQYRKSDGTMGSFMNDCWGTQNFTDAQLQNALDDLRHTPFHTFTHNFFRFNVLPGNVDWFDDYSAILNNARQSARIASLCSSEGILFDDEQYNYPLFNFAKLKDKTHRTWQASSQQARLRGRQIMQAFQNGWSAAQHRIDRWSSCSPSACRSRMRNVRNIPRRLTTFTTPCSFPFCKACSTPLRRMPGSSMDASWPTASRLPKNSPTSAMSFCKNPARCSTTAGPISSTSAPPLASGSISNGKSGPSIPMI